MNTEVGCYALLQGIFSTQGLKLHLSLKSPALAGRPFTTSGTWEAQAREMLCLSAVNTSQGNICEFTSPDPHFSYTISIIPSCLLSHQTY